MSLEPAKADWSFLPSLFAGKPSHPPFKTEFVVLLLRMKCLYTFYMREVMPKRSTRHSKAAVSTAETHRPTKQHKPEPKCFSLASDKASKVHIGTSGYSYKFWHASGSFYDGIRKTDEFKHYSSEFNALELNATFYGWFEEKTYDNWKEQADDARSSFTYAVKASQFYSHKKRLNVDEGFAQNWQRFWSRCQRLGSHLGPTLFQFPSNFKTTSIKDKQTISNLDKLRKLGNVLPKDGKFAFEFRHISWFCDEVYEVLRQNNWCLVIVDVHDPAGKDEAWYQTLVKGPNPALEAYPLDICSWGVYVRFHGYKGQYVGSYGAKQMANWAERIKRWVETGREVHVYFNNTDEGTPPSAIADARHLAAALRKIGVF